MTRLTFFPHEKKASQNKYTKKVVSNPSREEEIPHFLQVKASSSGVPLPEFAAELEKNRGLLITMLRRAMKLSALCVRMMVVNIVKYLPEFTVGLVNRLRLTVGG
jgi:hypothetical protein